MDTVIQVGEEAPDFALPDLQGKVHRLSKQRGRLVVVNFWSAECPWAERADQTLLEDLHHWGEAVQLWPIASNANESPSLVERVASERGLPLVLLDEDQKVADLYGAQTTPHLFVIDEQGILRYQGAINDVTFRQREPTHYYLREAVEALLAGRQPQTPQTSPYGCAIVRFWE
jgi:peroxiredoxin